MDWIGWSDGRTDWILLRSLVQLEHLAVLITTNTETAMLSNCQSFVIRILDGTCVKALAFQAPNKSPFEAQYKHQSLLFEI